MVLIEMLRDAYNEQTIASKTIEAICIAARYAGVSHAEIGRQLNLTRQAAHARAVKAGLVVQSNSANRGQLTIEDQAHDVSAVTGDVSDV